MGERVELTLLEKLCKRLGLALYLQIQVRLDGIHLGITHLASQLDVSYERQSRAVGALKPFIALVSDYIVEHIISFLILSSIAIWDYLTKSLLFT